MKKDNTSEKPILDAEKISKAIKENTDKSLQSIISETLLNLMKEGEENDDEDVEADGEGEGIIDNDANKDNAEGDTDSTDGEEGGEEGGDADTDDDEEWSEFEKNKVDGKDDEYDFTGEDEETALKVYNKLGDQDEIVLTDNGDGSYELKDNETGAEYEIEFSGDAEGDEEGEDDEESDGDIELDLEPDEEEGGEEGDGELEIELGGEEPDADGIDIEIEGGDDDEEDDEIKEGKTFKDGRDWKQFGGKKGGCKGGKCCKETLDEDGSGLNTKHKKVKTTNRLNKGAQNQKVTSQNGEYKGNTTAMNEAVISKLNSLIKENKEYRDSLTKLNKSIKEAAVLNVSLAQVVKLLCENTTSAKEKKNIIERFNNVKSIKESKALYESVKNELNSSKSNGVGVVLEKQIAAAPTLNETTIYKNECSNPSLDLWNRMENLYK